MKRPQNIEDDFPRAKLADIIRDYGQAVIENPRRLEALLRDLCPEHTREINLLAGAARERVPADLLAASGAQPVGILAGRLIGRLRDHLGVTDEAAQWAVETWALALGVQPLPVGGEAKPRLEAGNALIELGQFAQAAAEFREAVRLDPDYAEAYNNLGIALAEQGDMAAAVEAFRHAVRLDPQDAESQSNLDSAVLQLGGPAETAGPTQRALGQASAAGMPPPHPVSPSRQLKRPRLRLLLMACVIILGAFFLFRARPAPPPRLASPAPVTAPPTPDIPEVDTKFPVRWGEYTVEREDVMDGSAVSQQEARIVEENDATLWKAQDARIEKAFVLEVAGRGAKDLAVITDGGGTSNGGTEFYFSSEGGLHLLFSRSIYDDSIDFRRLDGSARPEIILNDGMSFLDGGHHGGNLIVVYRWDGRHYVNVTLMLPDLTRKQAQDAQARYLKSWQSSPETIYNSRIDALEYWANSMAIGEGAKAKDWLLEHADTHLRAHLLEIEGEVRKRIPLEGATLDIAAGEGAILDKKVEAATTPPPEAAPDTPPSTTPPLTDDAAAALGTPKGAPPTQSRDTMAAYAPAGSGLSDDPISPDALESKPLSAEDLAGKSLRALSISHNTIFARHGCIFSRPSVRSYFEAQPWYHPDPAFTAAALSRVEQENVQTIRAAEHARFGYGPPISMGLGAGRDPVAETATPGSGLSDRVLSLDRLQNSRLTDADMEGRSLAALSISYNAIYAAHGYIFQRKSLQRVFSPMPWYHPNPAFVESSLTVTEKINLQTIRAFERKRFGY